MKKLLLTLSLITSLTLLRCIGDTQLEITITEQPVGGKNVSELSCTFEGTLLNSTSPITTTIEWWWADSMGVQRGIEKTEQYTFATEYSEQISTTLTAPIDSMLIDSHWVRISWSDEDGTGQEIESNKVYCYIGPNTSPDNSSLSTAMKD